jgi:hypothetical protein
MTTRDSYLSRAVSARTLRAGLLAVPLLAVQVALTQVDVPAALTGIAAAQAQEGQKKEAETRRTPALRNKVYEKLAEAQAAAEAKDLATAAKILDGMLAGRRDNELNSYELANVYNLYAFIHYSREDYDGALRPTRTWCASRISRWPWRSTRASRSRSCTSCRSAGGTASRP